jgi:sulfite exporter TauE/SafE
MAVQGGLLATAIAKREEDRLKEEVKKGTLLPIVAFLIAKVVAYTLLGLLLGWFGSLFSLSLTAQIVIQSVVAVFMLGTALHLLNLHPIFRYFALQPPKFLTRKVRSLSKSRDLFAPALLGALTVFIPCGTTQAMMALAIASGHPLIGAAVLLAFTLGTSPIFFLLGYFTTRLGDVWHRNFLRLAALAIVILSLFNLNNALSLTGTRWTLTNLLRGTACAITYCDDNAIGSEADNAVSEDVTIIIQNNGYSPRRVSVKAGSIVKLKLVNEEGYSCAQAFTIPKLKIQKFVTPGTQAEIEFRAPNQKGTLAFMCGMGMYRGEIVIN